MRLIDADELIEKYMHKVVKNPGYVLASDIESAPTVPAFGQWISVTDRLPEDEEYVLIFTAGGSVLLGFYDSDGWDTLEGYLREVTHWMPLPEAPEEENFEKR